MKSSRQNPQASARSRAGLLDPGSVLGRAALSVLGLALVVVLVVIRLNGGS